MKTTHKHYICNAAKMAEVADRSVNLVVTSPPYPMIDMWDEIFSRQDRKIEKALKKWHREHPLPMLIFYNANWILRAAINIARANASYDVRIADDLNSAIKLIAEDKSCRLQANPADTFDAQHKSDDQNQKYVDEIISILSGINWGKQDPEAITKKMNPSHPFHPVAEAISLIKMDIDQLLQEREKSEKALSESRKKYKNILENIMIF